MNKKRAAKAVGKVALYSLLGWYCLVAPQHNFIYNVIDYAPHRYVIKKEKQTQAVNNAIEKTYAVFLAGFPGENTYLAKEEDKIRKLVSILDAKPNIEATLISYKDYSDKNNINSLKLKYEFRDKIKKISENITEKDSFIFAYSGHGAKKTNGDSLLTLDELIGINEKELMHYFNKMPAGHQILIFDCCYSGNFAEALQDEKRITISTGSKNHATVSSLKEGLIVDLFSNAKKADKDKNGKVSLEESFVYAAENEWWTNYTNVFLQLPRQCPHLYATTLNPNKVYLFE